MLLFKTLHDIFLPWGNGVFNQYRAAISGTMCYAIMGSATAWPSPTLIKMADHETPVSLDLTEISWMVSLLFLGHLVSPIPAGYLMEYFGPKKTCLCLSVLPLSSWLLIYLADSAVYLYIARFNAGLWVGITTTVMPLYVSEIAGPKLRGSLSTLNNLLLNIGVLFAYVIGPYFSYYSLATACEIITVVYIFLFLPMPESPYFLLQRKRRDDAFLALNWLRKGDTKESIEQEVNRMEKAVEERKKQRATLKDLVVNETNRKAGVISISYAVLRRMSGAGVLQAYSSITLPEMTLGVLDPDTCVIIIGFVSFLSSMMSTILSTKYRRRILLTASCVGCSLSTALIATWFYLNDHTTVDVKDYSDVIFWSLATFYALFNIGLGPVGTSIKGEIFSPSIKALASSMISILVAVTAFGLNKNYLILAKTFGMYVNFVLFSICSMTALVFTWTYVPDTHKKTLEEIQEILRESCKTKRKQYVASS